MKSETDMGNYNNKEDIQLTWEEGYSIEVKKDGDEILISANKEGLISLANHLTELAYKGTPGAHIHLDEYNALENNSLSLVIEKGIQ